MSFKNNVLFEFISSDQKDFSPFRNNVTYLTKRAYRVFSEA